MDGFIFELYACVSTLAAIMTYEELTEFLDRDYHNIVPSKWQNTLLEHDLLMPRGSKLHQLFRRAGIYSENEMTTVVLRLLYLQQRAQ